MFLFVRACACACASCTCTCTCTCARAPCSLESSSITVQSVDATQHTVHSTPLSTPQSTAGSQKETAICSVRAVLPCPVLSLSDVPPRQEFRGSHASAFAFAYAHANASAQTNKREGNTTTTLLSRAFTQRFIHLHEQQAGIGPCPFAFGVAARLSCLSCGSTRWAHEHDPSPNLSLSSTVLLPRRWWGAIPSKVGWAIDRLSIRVFSSPGKHQTTLQHLLQAQAQEHGSATSLKPTAHSRRTVQGRIEENGSTSTLTGTPYGAQREGKKQPLPIEPQRNGSNTHPPTTARSYRPAITYRTTLDSRRPSIDRTNQKNERNEQTTTRPSCCTPTTTLPLPPPGEFGTPPPLSISNSAAPLHRPRLIEDANVQSTPASWLAGRGIGMTATRAVPPTPRLYIPRSIALVRRTLLLLSCEWGPPRDDWQESIGLTSVCLLSRRWQLWQGLQRVRTNHCLAPRPTCPPSPSAPSVIPSVLRLHIQADSVLFHKQCRQAHRPGGSYQDYRY